MADVDKEELIDTLTEVYKEQSKESSEDSEDATEPESSEPVEEEVTAEAEDDEVEVEAEAAEDEDEEEPEQVFQPPEHWSSEEKEQFKALTPEAQQILIERDKQFQKGYQERVQAVSDLQAATEPYKQIVASMGMSEADAIRTLFATYMQIAQNPAGGILRLAQQFGAMDQLREQFAPDTDDDFVDPEIKALREQVTALNNQLGNFQAETQSQQQAALQSQIDSFRNQKDESGNLVHPYFEQVRHTMAPLVSQGKSMEEAYNQAVWMVPEFRESHMKTVEKKRKDETDLEKAQRVKAAKKAAATNKTSSKSQKEEADNLSVAEELRVAWNNLS
jgi:hypothetical protein